MMSMPALVVPTQTRSPPSTITVCTASPASEAGVVRSWAGAAEGGGGRGGTPPQQAQRCDDQPRRPGAAVGVRAHALTLYEAAPRCVDRLQRAAGGRCALSGAVTPVAVELNSRERPR